MTEIPEHLLKRSKAARAKAGGEEPAAGASDAPATAVAKADGAAAPAKPAAPAAPVKPAAPVVKPDSPVVAAYKARKKVPIWAMLGLAILPVWGFMYAQALTPEKKVVQGPLGIGAKVYASECSGCHMADGSGAAGGAYSFLKSDAVTTFPHIEDQLRWVSFGTKAYADAGIRIAGDPNRAGGPHVVGTNGLMPAQGTKLSSAQLLAVVCHERFALGGIEQSGDEWDKWCSPSSPAWVAAEGGTSIAELGTKVDGALEIGSTPKPGTTATK